MPKNPNQRSYYIPPDLQKLVDKGFRKSGHQFEAQFIRECLLAGLELRGIKLPDKYAKQLETTKREVLKKPL